jgi:hypothetical protein
MRGALLRIAIAVLLVAHTARADDIELPKSTAHLILPDDWKAARASSVVVAYKRADGAVLAVTRADVPNPDAWSKDKAKREAYADQVAAGIRASLTGTKKLTKKLGDMNNVPALDCEGTKDGAPVVVRVLLFRTYALSLAIELPNGADAKALKEAREILTKFGPTKPVPKD